MLRVFDSNRKASLVKKLALAAAAASVLFAGAASAADLAPGYAKAPPLAAPSWTGFYIGGNFGGGSDTAAINDNACFFCGDATVNKGFVTGGGQIGYNYQFGSGVVGIEADVNANSTKHNVILGADDGEALNTAFKSDISGSIRGRGGLAISNTLLYVTGGAAWANVKLSGVGVNPNTGLAFSNADTANSSTTAWGTVIGAGVDFALSPNWSVGAEFLHTAYQHSNAPLIFSGGSSCGSSGLRATNCLISSQLTTDVARIRFNYRIN
jgi:opacity protein-like surface antigen